MWSAKTKEGGTIELKNKRGAKLLVPFLMFYKKKILLIQNTQITLEMYKYLFVLCRV